jgi:hypothetical protein
VQRRQVSSEHDPAMSSALVPLGDRSIKLWSIRKRGAVDDSFKYGNVGIGNLGKNLLCKLRRNFARILYATTPQRRGRPESLEQQIRIGRIHIPRIQLVRQFQ